MRRGTGKSAGADRPPSVPRPKGARRTTPSPETLAALGQDRLIGLVLGEAARNPAFRKLVSAALAGLQGPDAVAAIVDRRLSALEGAKGYIDWQKRRSFTADLDATVTVILDELRPLDGAAALERLRRFLDGAADVLVRVDDSTGATQAVYARAGDALVEIAAGLGPDEAAPLAASLMSSFIVDPYGPVGVILHDLVAVLPEGGLAMLDAAVAKAVAGMPKAPDTGAAGASRFDAVRARILRLRQAIADRRGDADAFIAIEREVAPRRPDQAAIARRLLAAGRAGEALDWIRRSQEPGIRIVTRADLIAGFDPRAADRERAALEIEILDALDRTGEAQDRRWARFESHLDAPTLRAFLAKLPDFEDEEALLRALDHAEAFADPHRALDFLVTWPDLPRAARLVRARADAWRGEHYTLLAPAAQALAEDQPLAATILYRRLLDEILRTGRSAAYAHGARYLRALDGLAGRLEPGAIAPEPAVYRESLRRDHGRKHGFWSQLEG